MKTIAAQAWPLKRAQRAPASLRPAPASARNEHGGQHGEGGHRHRRIALQVGPVQHAAQGADGGRGRTASSPHQCAGLRRAPASAPAPGPRPRSTAARPAPARQLMRSRPSAAASSSVSSGNRLKISAAWRRAARAAGRNSAARSARRTGPMPSAAMAAQVARRRHGAAQARSRVPGERQQAAEADRVAQHRQRQRRHFGHRETRGHDGGAHLHAGAGGGQQRRSSGGSELQLPGFADQAPGRRRGAARSSTSSKPRDGRWRAPHPGARWSTAPSCDSPCRARRRCTRR